MVFVIHTLERNIQLVNSFGPFEAVQLRQFQRDKADIQFHKEHLQVILTFPIVTGEAGQVFDKHTIYFPIVNIRQKPLEIVTVAVNSGKSIVNIITDKFNTVLVKHELF